MIYNCNRNSIKYKYVKQTNILITVSCITLHVANHMILRENVNLCYVNKTEPTNLGTFNK